MDNELEELDKSGKLHFYNMLKSADESYKDERPIKFNYFNIVSKIKPELEKLLVTKGIEYLEDKLDCLIYPYGHEDSNVLRYHYKDPPEPDKNESYEYHLAKESLPPKMFLKSKTFYTSETWLKIKDEIRLDKELIKKVYSLLNLEKLEHHINSIIEEIKNSDWRNYANTHETELFQEGVIFKIYLGKEQTDRLRAESVALEFFQKKLPELNTPRVYCHGGLGDFYVLLEEKLGGVTAEQFFKENRDVKKKNTTLRNIIENLADIHLNGRNLDTTYGEIDEKKCLEWFKAGFLDRLSEYNLDLELLIKCYEPAARHLSSYKNKVLNKDANLKNWIITDDSKIHAIDFENTGIRPPQLDLVQLLEDKTLNLKRNDKEELKRYYVQQFNRKEGADMPKIDDYETFNKVYHCALLHRYLINTGFSSEKFKVSDPKKCQRLQVNNLNSCLDSLKYLISNELVIEDKERYMGLYSILSNLKEEIPDYKS